MTYWEHQRPVRRSRAFGISDIARTSAALLDEGGLRALTVRAAAERLGVAAASLYSRIESLDDLFDLALDHALGEDGEVREALAQPDLHALMLMYFRHLRRHPWACQVIAMRAPRGPHYLELSERMVVLLEAEGADDPLGTAYALSNFVIGSAATAGMATGERSTAVDPVQAPAYARLHTTHTVDPDSIVRSGLRALGAGGAPGAEARQSREAVSEHRGLGT